MVTHLMVYHPNNVPKTTAFFTALNIYKGATKGGNECDDP